MAISTKYIKTTSLKQIDKFQRSPTSKLLEQVHVYSMDLERITGLRNKAFKNYDSNDGYQEWERYNKLIETMQHTLMRLHARVDRAKLK